VQSLARTLLANDNQVSSAKIVYAWGIGIDRPAAAIAIVANWHFIRLIVFARCVSFYMVRLGP